MKYLLPLSVLILLAGFGCTVAPPERVISNVNVAPVVDRSDLIRVTAPLPNAIVTSPLRVTGEATGLWYFEASFPVRVLDANGQELGVVPVQAIGDWMTEDFVPFNTEISFSAPTTATGTVVFEKDNPSGLSEHADELRIPVRFEP